MKVKEIQLKEKGKEHEDVQVECPECGKIVLYRIKKPY
jgi:predicted RNA-binding Zn-ribbon protein involved in translation (DUF1610 family)